MAKDYGGKKALLHPYGPLVSDVWTDIHRVKHNKYRDEHPCQLPIHLLERIILMSSNENDIILDPFNGTGTTLIAAKRLGRRYIGFDLDPEYVAITKDKLKQEEANSRLGESWVSFYLDEVVTIRNEDWHKIKEYYIVPNNPEEIDHTPIVLKNKVYVSVPLKSEINGHNKIEPSPWTLFEPGAEYKTKRKAPHNKNIATSGV